MATFPAFCNICKKEVSAHTLLLSEDDLRSALDRNEEVSIGHPVYDDDNRTSADHIWNLSGEKKEDLRKLLHR